MINDSSHAPTAQTETTNGVRTPKTLTLVTPAPSAVLVAEREETPTGG